MLYWQLESNAPEQRQQEINIKQLTIEKLLSKIKINNHMWIELNEYTFFLNSMEDIVTSIPHWC